MKRQKKYRSGRIGLDSAKGAATEAQAIAFSSEISLQTDLADSPDRLRDPTAPTSLASSKSGGWLVHPVFDLLLVANVLWPLLVWLGTSDGIARRDGLLFWQVYFITTPHRWVTLLLVFGDRQRFKAKRWLFVGIAGVALAVTLGVRIGTGGLTCLLAIDYLWNAWHFSAQHHGIAKLYSRRWTDQSCEKAWEKWAFRLFLLYVIFRVAVSTGPTDQWNLDLSRIDFFVLVIPAVLLSRAVYGAQSWHDGGIVYRASVFALFIGMLWAVHMNRPEMVLAFATASAMFHATEYLAIVGWTLRKKRNADNSALGLLGWIIPRWASLMIVFIMALGASGYWLDQRVQEAWLTINVAVAFLHYAYDGLIWRRTVGGGHVK